MTKVLVERDLLESIADNGGYTSDDDFERLRTVLTQPAHGVASVPDGFVMVPAEPTDAMKLAGNDALAQHWGAGDAYRAMLAASRLPVQPLENQCERTIRNHARRPAACIGRLDHAPAFRAAACADRADCGGLSG